MSGSTSAFVVLTVAALAWLGLGAALLALFHPRRPHEGPATSELRDEPPAVVNLITHQWKVTASAAAATLLDLADRGYVDIVQVSPEQDVVELRRTGRDARELLPYERQVLDHLRRAAVDGVVPANALTTGPAAVSDRWWRRFRLSVEQDARRRGVSRLRFPAGVTATFAAGLVALFLWLLLVVSGARDAAPDEGPSWLAVLAAVAAVGLCAVVAKRFDRERQRDTDAGLAAASHWLGVRRAYTHGRYDELTPAAVVLYERHLAYAAAETLETAGITTGAKTSNIARRAKRSLRILSNATRVLLGWSARGATSLTLGLQAGPNGSLWRRTARLPRR